MSSSRTVIVPVIVLALAFLLFTPAAAGDSLLLDRSERDLGHLGGSQLVAEHQRRLPPLSWPGAGDADFYSNGQTTTTVTVNNTQTVGNITFDGSGYTLSGGTLNLTAGTITANQNATIGSVIGELTNQQ